MDCFAVQASRSIVFATLAHPDQASPRLLGAVGSWSNEVLGLRHDQVRRREARQYVWSDVASTLFAMIIDVFGLASA